MTQQHSEPFPPADDLESEPTEPISLAPPATLGQRLEAFERRVERRFDLLHQELHLLRVQVTGDHATRLTRVETATGTTLGAKARLGGKYAAGVALGAVVARAAARAAAQQWPQAQPVVDLLETLLGPLGL